MIRNLTHHDMSQILQLFAKLPQQHRGWSQRIDEKWFSGEITHGKGLASLQTADSSSLQAVLFYRELAGEFEITFLMADPDCSRQGLMTALFSYYLTEITKESPTFLEVHEANSQALAFYQKHGFKESGRRPSYYPDGGAAICLVRR